MEQEKEKRGRGKEIQWRKQFSYHQELIRKSINKVNILTLKAEDYESHETLLEQPDKLIANS